MKNAITRRLLLSSVAALMALGVQDLNGQGYGVSTQTWPADTVSYFVNPRNASVSEAAAVSALQMAADTWNQASEANIELVYAGYTSGSALVMNRKNEVFFREGPDGSPAAETYTWWDDAGQLLDADVVFYEGAHTFFAFSGCAEGVYVESVGMHQFGHMLGLLHSSASGATMSSQDAGPCDRTQLELQVSDISSLEAMYPAVIAEARMTTAATRTSSTGSASLTLAWDVTSTNATGFRIERSLNGSSFSEVAVVGGSAKSYPDGGLASNTTYYYRVAAYNSSGTSPYSNTTKGKTSKGKEEEDEGEGDEDDVEVPSADLPPVVTLTSPKNGGTYPGGAAVLFSATATDPQTGDLTARLTWKSSLVGDLGTGGSFSRTLPAGTHVITARAEGRSRLSNAKSVTVTVAESAKDETPSARLVASAYRERGKGRARLSWTGLETVSVEIRRDGSRVGRLSVGTDRWIDSNVKANSHTYKVCEYGKSTCTNAVKLSW